MLTLCVEVCSNHDLLLSSDYFVDFSICLCMEESEARKVWEEALGRYDRAMLKLVVDLIHEAEKPERKLESALMKMRTPESLLQAKDAIENGNTLNVLP